MIRSAIEKLVKSLLSGNLKYSNDLKHINAVHTECFTNLIKPDMHRCLEFATIIKGTATLQLGSMVIKIQPNEAWVILPNTPHCEGFIDKKKSYVLLWAVVISRGVNFFLSEYNSSKESRLSTNRLFIEFPQAKDLWEISRDHMLSESILLQAKFISLFLTACVQGLIDTNNVNNKSLAWTASHRKLVQQIKDYIEQHYSESLSIAELSAFAGYTPNHLSILFKRFTNQSIHQYLTQVRLKLAKELLMAKQHQIKEVAFLVGFNNPLYFSRIFKKIYGRPPSEYL